VVSVPPSALNTVWKPLAISPLARSDYPTFRLTATGLPRIYSVMNVQVWRCWLCNCPHPPHVSHPQVHAVSQALCCSTSRSEFEF
jgi:hypothetical protein